MSEAVTKSFTPALARDINATVIGKYSFVYIYINIYTNTNANTHTFETGVLEHLSKQKHCSCSVGKWCSNLDIRDWDDQTKVANAATKWTSWSDA